MGSSLAARPWCEGMRLLVDRWWLHYNHQRIQRALGKLTPAAFAATCPAPSPLRFTALARPDLIWHAVTARFGNKALSGFSCSYRKQAGT